MQLIKTDKKLIRDPSAVLMMGMMGSGKTSLGHLLLEQSKFKQKFAVVPELEDGHSVAWNNMPDSVTPVAFSEDVLGELPMKSAIFIDDASVVLYARDHGKSQNKLVDKSILMSRQRQQTLIFATHNARKIDIGALGELSAIFIKEPAFLQEKIERAEFKMFVTEARKHFDLVSEKDRKKCVFVVARNKGQFLQIPQASYWKEELGNVWVLDEKDAKNANKVVKKPSFETDIAKRIYRHAQSNSAFIHPTRDLNEFVKRNGDKCPCADRICPCEDSIEELASDRNACKCTLIVGKKYLEKWCN